MDAQATSSRKPDGTVRSTAKHLVLDASSRLLDTTVVLDERGRPQPASEALEEVLGAANSAITDFRVALAGEQEPQFEIDQFDLALALEASMSSDKAPRGGSVVLYVAKEVPPPLEITEVEEDGALPAEREGDGPWAVGPLALLRTGHLVVLQEAVLHAHRAMGALSAGPCSSLMPGFTATRRSERLAAGKEGEELVVVGSAQHRLWLEVSERAFPADVGQAR